MIDFAGINGVAGVAAGAFDAIGLAGGAAVTEAGSEAATGGDLSGMAASFAAAAVPTGATAGAAPWVTGGWAFAGDAGQRDPGAEEVAEADGADEGELAEVVVEGVPGGEGSAGDDTGEEDTIEEGAIEEDAIKEGWGVACGEPAAAFCRAIEPVTESRPCSSTVMREYSRSRSPFRVSMAEASRRVSFWLCLAIDWNCCACRARSALANCSCRNPIED
jgi:hypothetical protein